VAIDDLDVERCYGDLGDDEALRAAMSDRDVVFYCVVDTRFYLRDPAPLFQTNVESLRRVLDIAAEADLHRFVFCSTSRHDRHREGRRIRHRGHAVQLARQRRRLYRIPAPSRGFGAGVCARAETARRRYVRLQSVWAS
jgi:sugar phosphate isomerase/epimerase